MFVIVSRILEGKKKKVSYFYYSLIVLEEKKRGKIRRSQFLENIYSIEHAKRSFKRAISIIKQSKLIVKLLCYAGRSSPTSRATFEMSAQPLKKTRNDQRKNHRGKCNCVTRLILEKLEYRVFTIDPPSSLRLPFPSLKSFWTFSYNL